MATERGDREKLDPKGLEAAIQAATDLPAEERPEALVALVSDVLTAYLAAADLLEKRESAENAAAIPFGPSNGEMRRQMLEDDARSSLREIRDRAALSPEPESEG